MYFAFPTRRRTAFSILTSLKLLLTNITQLEFVDVLQSIITKLNFIDKRS